MTFGIVLYALGAFTVITELLDSGSGRWAHIPPEMQAYTAVIVLIIALLWPLFAAMIVCLRIVGAYRHG